MHPGTSLARVLGGDPRIPAGLNNRYRSMIMRQRSLLSWVTGGGGRPFTSHRHPQGLCPPPRSGGGGPGQPGDMSLRPIVPGACDETRRASTSSTPESSTSTAPHPRTSTSSQVSTSSDPQVRNPDFTLPFRPSTHHQRDAKDIGYWLAGKLTEHRSPLPEPEAIQSEARRLFKQMAEYKSNVGMADHNAGKNADLAAATALSALGLSTPSRPNPDAASASTPTPAPTVRRQARTAQAEKCGVSVAKALLAVPGTRLVTQADLESRVQAAWRDSRQTATHKEKTYFQAALEAARNSLLAHRVRIVPTYRPTWSTRPARSLPLRSQTGPEHPAPPAPTTSDSAELRKIILWLNGEQCRPARLLEAGRASGLDLSHWRSVRRVGNAASRRLEVLLDSPSVREDCLRSIQGHILTNRRLRIRAVRGRTFRHRVACRLRRRASQRRPDDHTRTTPNGWCVPRRRARRPALPPATPAALPLHNAFADLPAEVPVSEQTAPRPSDSLNLISFNACGATTKMADLHARLGSELPDADVIAVQETWWRDTAFTPIPGYVCIARNRPNQTARYRGEGGVACYVRWNLTCTRLPDPEYEGIVAVQIETTSGVLSVVCFYSPLDNETERATLAYESLRDTVASCSVKGPVVVLGDFNARVGNRHARVGPHNEDCPVSANGARLLHLLDACDLFCLNGRVEGPVAYTRMARNERSVLDYALISSDLVGSGCEMRVHHSPYGSDHLPLLVHIPIPDGVQRASRPNSALQLLNTNVLTRLDEKGEAKRLELRLGLHQALADWKARCEALSTGDIPEDPSAEMEELWTAFSTTVMTVASGILGLRKKGLRRTFWTPELSKLAKRRDDAFHAFRNNPAPETWASYVDLRRSLADTAAERRASHWAEICDSAEKMETVHPATLWRRIRRLTGKKRARLDPTRVNRARTTTEACEIWKTHFSRVGNDEATASTPAPTPVPVADLVPRPATPEVLEAAAHCSDPISPEEVNTALSQMANHKAPGNDRIPTEVLRFGDLASFLSPFFSLCLRWKKTPSAWKEAIVVPVPKKGTANVPDNYRGISLISCVCKLYCRILNARLAKILEPQIAEEQGGFRPGRGCDDQIFTLSEVIKRYYTQRKSLYLVFVDFEKAYDRVWRDALWAKLHNLYVPTDTIAVLQELYSRCSNRVRVGDCVSEPFETTLGLKQGCVMSPLLFNAYINDLALKLRTSHGVPIGPNRRLTSLFFADDLVIVAESLADCQRSLQTLESFCASWRMRVNVSKTEVMPVSAAPGDLRFEGQPLTQCTEYRYLGIPLRNDGKWDSATDHAVQRANQATQQLRRFLLNRNLAIRTRALTWLALVRPLLEYAGGLWTPSGKDSKKVDTTLTKSLTIPLGVPISTATPAVLGDFGVIPMRYRLQQGKVRFVAKLAGMTEDRLAKAVWRHYCQTPVSGSFRQAIHSINAAVLRPAGLDIDRLFAIPRTKEEIARWERLASDAVEDYAWKELRDRMPDLSTLERYRTLPGVCSRPPWVLVPKPDDPTKKYWSLAYPRMQGYLRSKPCMAAYLRFGIRANNLPLGDRCAKIYGVDGKCKACKAEVETLRHMLFHCPALAAEQDELRLAVDRKIGPRRGDDVRLVQGLMLCGREGRGRPGEADCAINDALCQLWRRRCSFGRHDPPSNDPPPPYHFADAFLASLAPPPPPPAPIRAHATNPTSATELSLPRTGPTTLSAPALVTSPSTTDSAHASPRDPSVPVAVETVDAPDVPSAHTQHYVHGAHGGDPTAAVEPA